MSRLGIRLRRMSAIAFGVAAVATTLIAPAAAADRPALPRQ
ncbi:hypothetical protein [Kibdelosporangium aridum]|nr:hypothetical protein [Kibdelosporangium aridum]